MLRTQNQERLLIAGLTAVFIGYLSVWLPGPAAGLRFLGVELGEWIKFLGVGAIRDLFYLPPIILGLMLAVLTMGWENGRWQTWLMRGLALLVSLLAFPAYEDLMGDYRSQYLLRVALSGLVGLTIILVSLFGKKLVSKMGVAALGTAGNFGRYRGSTAIVVLRLAGAAVCEQCVWGVSRCGLGTDFVYGGLFGDNGRFPLAVETNQVWGSMISVAAATNCKGHC